MPLGVEINPRFYRGKKTSGAKKKWRAQSKPTLQKIKPPSIIGKGLATALPKEYKEEL